MRRNHANDNRTTWAPHAQAGLKFGEIIVDNFAGGGGASTGIELGMADLANGEPTYVDIAINHDPEAIAMHAMNHPHTKHYCESVWDVDPREVTQGRPVGLAWFSPDCKHFSKAKGGKPVSKKIRGLAWVALRWAATVKPRVIMLENVEEFVTWGPITSEGRPCPKNRGRTFNSFCNALRRQGYVVEHRELRARDYGAATIRKRLFLIARRDGLPIVWPAPTHGDPRSDAVLTGQLLPWRTSASIIDWSLPCPSIFERKRPLAEKTLQRIAAGIMRYVVNAPEPFLVKVNHGYDYFRGQALDAPMQTITSKCGTALVVPTLVQVGYGERPGQAPRVPGLDKPLGTVVAGGGKHALVAAFLAKNYTGVVGSDLNDPIGTITSVDHHSLVTAHIQRDYGNSVGHAASDPLGTVTAGGGGKSALVSSHLVKLRGTCKDGQPVTEPLATISAQGTHLGEVRAFLVKYFSTGAIGQGLDEGLHTITAKPRFGLVMVQGEPYQIVDIGMRMLQPHELYAAQSFPAGYIHDRKADGSELSKEAQTRMCGNSVCPELARALVRANMAVPAVKRDQVAA